MTTAVLILTHGNVGREMADEVDFILGGLPMPCEVVGVSPIETAPEIGRELIMARDRLRTEADELLLLTDMYGATPSNLALRLNGVDAVVHGINLSMLLKVANYAHLGARELAAKAVTGGRQAIFSGRRPESS